MSTGRQGWNDAVIEEFRATGGTVTTGGFGRRLVLLHHVGARTGLERVSPVMAVRDDADTWFVAASKGGAPDHPGWYHNLVAHPDVEIETPDDGVVAVRARELLGVERDEAWARFTAMSAGFRQYESRTSRTIPVIALHRRDAGSGPEVG
jgi:deazaflavin-dependent oxidoreductase (nitroreductase family)